MSGSDVRRSCDATIPRYLKSFDLLLLVEIVETHFQLITSYLPQNFFCSFYKGRESMLGLESWASGSILTGGNILLLEFSFSYSKYSEANIGIIAILVHFEKTLLG